MTALPRLVFGVSHDVAIKVDLLGEALGAAWTLIGFDSGMNVHVLAQVALLGKCLAADTAQILLVRGMDLLVTTAQTGTFELLVANITGVGRLTGMDPVMVVQAILGAERLQTCLALKLFALVPIYNNNLLNQHLLITSMVYFSSFIILTRFDIAFYT